MKLSPITKAVNVNAMLGKCYEGTAQSSSQVRAVVTICGDPTVSFLNEINGFSFLTDVSDSRSMCDWITFFRARA